MISAQFLGRITVRESEDILTKQATLRRSDAMPDTLYLFEHPSTFSFKIWERDRRAIRDKMLFDVSCAANDIDLERTNRGGGLMYHGPGQLICAPVLMLGPGFGIPYYRMALEETMIRILKDLFNLNAFRICYDDDQHHWATERGEPIDLFRNEFHNGVQGVWVFDRNGEVRKIGFLGAQFDLRSRVITHGCALNLAPSLEFFDLIDPCNLPGVQVSSVERLKGFRPKVNARLAHTFAETFTEVIGEDNLIWEN